ncbi:MAG: peptidoglycan DD-metalloendopeptidase family protein [Gaiellales bacterium]
MSSRHKGCAVGAVGLVGLVGAALCLPLFGAMAIGVGGGGRTAGGGGDSDTPARVLTAYRVVDGWCPGLRWQLLAGIGAVESGHGTTGGARADEVTGEVEPPIFGVALDGSAGVRALPIGPWLGWFGLTGPWERAVGPMQVLPGTFTAWAVDGDGDGAADPHDIDDAVATAANYVCAGRGGQVDDERAALRRYNADDAYVARVLTVADSLGSGAGRSILCPVAGPTTFTDTWLAPRSGGRQHKGVDMFAAEGTPVVAPVAGEVQFGSDDLGGLAFHLWGDDGTYYYGAHLASFAGSQSHVEAGTVVGYVGRTGNAVGTEPHLHFEIHPGRSRVASPAPVNPTAITTAACFTAHSSATSTP